MPPTEARVRAVLEPGEQLLWSGAPSVDALAASANRGPVVIALSGVSLLVTGVVLWRFRDFLPVPAILAASAAGLVALAFLGTAVRGRALRRYAESLSYAITDRRLLILEGDVITDVYTPSDLRASNAIVPRAPGYADVVFENIPYTESYHGRSAVWARAPDASRIETFAERTVRRERYVKAFKALPDADAVERRIEEWIRADRADAEAAADDFVARASAGSFVSDEVASSLQRIDNPALGLRIAVPRDWDVRVRTRTVPTGKLAVEIIEWMPLEAGTTWNTLQAEGELDAAVQLELVDTSVPVLTPRKVGYGILFLLFGGRTLSLERNVRRDGFEGFSLVRRNPSNNREGPRMLQRHLVLHDGSRQLVLLTEWPEGDRDLERLMEAVGTSLVVA